jgi:hypothetical protein
MPTPSGLTQTGTNAATDATFVVFSAVSRLDVIEFHHLPLKAL